MKNILGCSTVDKSKIGTVDCASSIMYYSEVWKFLAKVWKLVGYHRKDCRPIITTVNSEADGLGSKALRYVVSLTYHVQWSAR